MKLITRITNLTAKIILFIDDNLTLVYIIKNKTILNSEKLDANDINYQEKLYNIISLHLHTPIYILYHTLEEQLSLIEQPDINTIKNNQLSKNHFSTDSNSTLLQDMILIEKPLDIEKSGKYLYTKCRININLTLTLKHLLNNNFKIKGIYSLLAIETALLHNTNSLGEDNKYKIFYLHHKLSSINQLIFKGQNLVSTKNLLTNEKPTQHTISTIISKDIELTDKHLKLHNKNIINYTAISNLPLSFKSRKSIKHLIWKDFKQLNFNQSKTDKVPSFAEIIVEYITRNNLSGFNVIDLTKLNKLKKLSLITSCFFLFLLIISCMLVSKETYNLLDKKYELETIISKNQNLLLQELKLTDIITQFHQKNTDMIKFNNIILVKNSYPFDLIHKIINSKKTNVKLTNFRYQDIADTVSKSITTLNLKANIDNTTDFINKLRQKLPYNNIKYFRISNKIAQSSIPIEIKIIEPIKIK